MKRIILALAIITAFSPGVSAWVENNRLYIEKNGIVTAFVYTVIGEGVSTTSVK